jgi:5'-3' exonuclease
MLIVDGTYLVYKSYYITEKIKKTYEILDESHYLKTARNVFMKLLGKVKNRANPKSLFVVFDCDGNNFRHDLLPSYKSNRREKPPELPAIKQEIYDFLKVHQFQFQIADYVEADDLIASYVHQFRDEEVMVFTGDGDLAALVMDHVTLLLEKKKNISKINVGNFHHYFPIPPSRFADFKALQGDKSDFLKGLDGLFRTDVLHMFMEYASIEDFIDRGQGHHLYDKILAEKNKVLINKQVASMKTDCKLEFDPKKALLSSLSIPPKIAEKIEW